MRRAMQANTAHSGFRAAVRRFALNEKRAGKCPLPARHATPVEMLLVDAIARQG